jgi:hypothetical protein
MPITTQLERTPSVVISEIMEGSGISLARGRYIEMNHLSSQLVSRGVKVEPDDFNRSMYLDSYGRSDNIFTQVQGVSYWMTSDSKSTYTFNPLRELMGSYPLNCIARQDGVPTSRYFGDRINVLLNNPREGTRLVQDMFGIFAELPQDSQDWFLDQISTYPCSLHSDITDSIPIQIVSAPLRSLTIGRMLTYTPKSKREGLKNALYTMALHNICVDKEQILRAELKSLSDLNVETIPTEWQPGSLDEAVVAAKADELNELLAQNH